MEPPVFKLNCCFVYLLHQMPYLKAIYISSLFPFGIFHSVQGLRYVLEDRRIVVEFSAEAGIFVSSTPSRRTLGPTELPVHFIPKAIS
jgi:hypothetical protein